MGTTKIAIPLAGGRLTAHFGHCEAFAILDLETEQQKILAQEEVVPPPHQPGLLPRYIADLGATVVIAGGMGGQAQKLFQERGVQVVSGAPSLTPQELAIHFMAGTLTTGSNACDH